MQTPSELNYAGVYKLLQNQNYGRSTQTPSESQIAGDHTLLLNKVENNSNTLPPSKWVAETSLTGPLHT
jgi:hypothetical protein